MVSEVKGGSWLIVLLSCLLIRSYYISQTVYICICIHIHNFFRVLQAWRDILSAVCIDSALWFVLSDRKAPNWTFMTQMHTTYKVYYVAHMNSALIYNIPSSVPASFSSCTATCSDLAGFQCALIFSPFFLLQNLILMPLGHNTVPVVLHWHGEQFSDFLVYRHDLLFPQLSLPSFILPFCLVSCLVQNHW